MLAKTAKNEEDPSSEGALSRLRIDAVTNKQWAWDEIVSGTRTNLEVRFLIDGLTFTSEGMDGLAERYFEIAPELWDKLTNEMAQNTLEGLFPLWDISIATVERAEALLAREDIPAGLRRIVSEGKARVERALRNRVGDAGAEGAAKTLR